MSTAERTDTGELIGKRGEKKPCRQRKGRIRRADRKARGEETVLTVERTGMESERLERQLRFIREADKIKHVFRQTNIGDNSRAENDAEHSWHLALMAMVLREYANEEVDLCRAVQMTVIHDIVEIDAGDTYAYDPEANQSKQERERKAAERIFPILPDDQAVFFRGLWDEFEAGKTMEAKFAIVMDVLHPILMNDMGEGKAWVTHHVRAEQVLARVERVRPGSERLYQVCREIVEKNVKKGYLI